MNTPQLSSYDLSPTHSHRKNGGPHINSGECKPSAQLDPSRTLLWSASLLYYTGLPSPKVKHWQLRQAVSMSDMERPNISLKSCLTKTASTDSGAVTSSSVGTGEGGSTLTVGRLSISPFRKRHSSCGSASTNSSGSLGSFKEKLEKSDSLKGLKSLRKRSSFMSFISRTGSLGRHKKSVNLAVAPGSTDSSQSSDSIPKLSASKTLRDSFKAAKSLLPSAKINLLHSSKSCLIITEDKSENTSEAERKNDTLGLDTSAITNITKNIKKSKKIKSEAGSTTLKSTSLFNSQSVSSNKDTSDTIDLTVTPSSEHAVASPVHSNSISQKKQQKEKEKEKSPSKKVSLVKSISRRMRRNSSNSKETKVSSHLVSEEPNETKSQAVFLHSEGKKSPEMVEFENEPRKLTPKSRTRFSTVEKDRELNDLKMEVCDDDAISLNGKIETFVVGSEDGKRNAVDEKSQNGTEAVSLNSVHEYIEHKAVTNSSIENNFVAREHRNGEDNLETELSTAEDVDNGKVHSQLDAEIKGHSEHQGETGHQKSITDTLTAFKDRNVLVLLESEIDGISQSLSPTSSSSVDEEHATIENENILDDHDPEVRTDDYIEDNSATTGFDEQELKKSDPTKSDVDDEESSFTESFKHLEPFTFDLEPMKEGKRERLYKVLVVGELGTGKTSIIKRYVHQFFSQHYRATIGVDFALKVLRWDPETVVRLQLWDIAGQERFGSMTRVYYKEAVGAFVVFDVTRAATLEAVPKWKADLDTKVVLPDGRSIPTVLLANKSDQPKEGIAANREKMNDFCQQQGFSAWFETSAKDNINIDESANFLVSKILEMDRWSQEPLAPDPEKLDLSANGKHKPGGSSSCAC